METKNELMKKILRLAAYHAVYVGDEEVRSADDQHITYVSKFDTLGIDEATRITCLCYAELVFENGVCNIHHGITIGNIIGASDTVSKDNSKYSTVYQAFKHEEVYPVFGERLEAVKMLADESSDDEEMYLLSIIDAEMKILIRDYIVSLNTF